MADQAEARDTQDQTVGNDDATPNIPGRDMDRQTILSFGSRPTHQHQDVNYSDMDVRRPKSELARKVMGEYTFRTHEGQSLATCRYCGLEYEAIRSLHRNKTSKQREIKEESERQSASAMPDEEDGDLQRVC
ncbi:hypothetical protein R1sor_013434 [Riccia sorocarpa]|uniref:Uncharacterized protein n=1 Tax=Riccia sorocarpa TaxID=122646 RepID=A0ABD3HA39_9MARC